MWQSQKFMKNLKNDLYFLVLALNLEGVGEKIAHQRKVVYFPSTPQPLNWVRVAAPKGRKQSHNS